MDPPPKLVRVVGERSPPYDRHKLGAYTRGDAAAAIENPSSCTGRFHTNPAQYLLVQLHHAIGRDCPRLARQQDVGYSLARQLVLAASVEFLWR
jgi:hypothetical protein